MQLFKSMSLLQKEKLVVIKKELLHLYNIAYFYKSKNSNMQQRTNMAKTICTEIEHHIDFIKEIYEKVEDNQQYINKKKYALLPFLVRYDLINNKIKNILNIVKFIQSKLSQFLQDGFNQYIPIPMTSKRYSSKGFLDYLKHYYTDILSSVINDKAKAEEISPIIFWGHNTSFTTEEINTTNHSKHYIETAYWNYEIPILLPTMSHELGHIILRQEDKGLLGNFYKNIYNFINHNYKTRELFDLSKNSNNPTLDEIISDIFAYMILGDAYIITMAHELLGKGFAELFYNEKHQDISFHFIDTDALKMIEPLARLIILLDFREMADNNSSRELQSQIDEIQNIIDHIAPALSRVDDTSLDFHEVNEKLEEFSDFTSLLKIYFEYYPNLSKEYDKFHAIIYSYVDCIRNYYDGELDINTEIMPIAKKFDNSASIQKYKKIFDKLWTKRLRNLNYSKNSISKNIFRKLILLEDKVLHSYHKGIPYELTLFKTRTDAYSKKSKTFEEMFLAFKSDINNSYYNSPLYTQKNQEQYFCFDLFNALSIVEKKDKNDLKIINNFLKEYDIHNEAKERYFYTYKYSLIKITDDIIINTSSDYPFNLLLQLQLIHNNSYYTIKSIQSITSYLLKTNKIKCHSVEIFKSLGPKEIIINFKKIDINSIFTLKSELIKLTYPSYSKFRFNNTLLKSSPITLFPYLNPEKLFRRSYSIIYGEFTKISSSTISNSNQITSIIRLKAIASNKDIKYILKNYTTNINTVLHTTGITDLQIIWEKNTKLSDIFLFYDDLIKKEYSSDIQTKINEIFSI